MANNKDVYRVHDIQKDTRVFLTVSDIAKALGVTKNAFRAQVKNDVNSVPFPVIKIGDVILIPRKKFLDYLGYDCYSGENDYFGYLVPDEPPTVLPKM